jgi:hypothetical protein
MYTQGHGTTVVVVPTAVHCFALCGYQSSRETIIYRVPPEEPTGSPPTNPPIDHQPATISTSGLASVIILVIVPQAVTHDRNLLGSPVVGS